MSFLSSLRAYSAAVEFTRLGSFSSVLVIMAALAVASLLLLVVRTALAVG